MLKQLFNNLFDRKNAKFGFKLQFIKGFVNRNDITKITKGKCLLNFENQTFIIKQNNEIISDNMNDVYKIRTWIYENNVYFAISMKTHSEYMFSFGENGLLLKSLENYSNAFNIPFEYCGESENDNE